MLAAGNSKGICITYCSKAYGLHFPLRSVPPKKLRAPALVRCLGISRTFGVQTLVSARSFSGLRGSLNGVLVPRPLGWLVAPTRSSGAAAQSHLPHTGPTGSKGLRAPKSILFPPPPPRSSRVASPSQIPHHLPAQTPRGWPTGSLGVRLWFRSSGLCGSTGLAFRALRLVSPFPAALRLKPSPNRKVTL